MPRSQSSGLEPPFEHRAHGAPSLIEQCSITLSVTRERTRDKSVGNLYRRSDRHPHIAGFCHAVVGDERIGDSLGDLCVGSRVCDGGLQVDNVSRSQRAVARLGAEEVGDDVDAAQYGIESGGVSTRRELVSESREQALGVSRREALKYRDAIGEVAVNSTDGGSGSFGNHRRRESLVADLGDDGRRGVKEGREPRRAASLHRLVADGGCGGKWRSA